VDRVGGMNKTKIKWTHNKLLKDLALAKGTIYTEVPLGSVFLNQMRRVVLPRADMINVRPSYTRFCIDIFEVKQNRADLLRDMKSGKWKKYLDYCHRFYFAILSGIAKPQEIPQEAGVMIRGGNGWKVSRGAPSRDVTIPVEMLLSMLFYKQKVMPSFVHRRNLSYWSKSGGYYELDTLGKEISAALKIYRKRKYTILKKERDEIQI